MADPIAWVKEHPWTTAGIAVVAIGGIFLFATMSGGASAGTIGSGGATSGVDALTLQNNAESAAAAQQSSAQNFTLAQNAQNIQGQLDLANLQLTGTQDQIAAQLQANTANNALAAYQTEVNANVTNTATAAQLTAIQSQLSQQEAINASNNATTINLAGINANTQITQAADFTSLEKTIATTQAAVAEAQTNATVQIAGINAQVSENAAKQSANASIFGSALGFLGAIL